MPLHPCANDRQVVRSHTCLYGGTNNHWVGATWSLRLLDCQCHSLCMQALEQRGVSSDSSDLLKHNLVVFRDGEGALQACLPACLQTLLPVYD